MQIVVVDILMHPMGDIVSLIAAQVSIVQAQGFEPACQARGMHVELAQADGLVAGIAEDLGHHVVEVPCDAVLIPHASVMGGCLPGEQRDAGGDAGWACAVGMVE